MKAFILLFLGLQFFNPVFSCGNEYGHSLDGRRIHTRYFYLSQRMLHFDTEEIHKRLDALTLKVQSGKESFKNWSDISVNLMKLGKVDSAIRILLPLIEEHPNEYNLLSNLGTCYELNGNLKKALEYISKGYEINPSSHSGTEWIHIKILKAKIKEKNAPGWLNQNSIIEISKLPRRYFDRRNPRSIEKINRSFFYQLRTRAPFTPGPNKVMANLLETFGDFNREYGTYENALLGYIYALDFQESNWMYRKIKAKIKDLNEKRDNMRIAHELSDAFVRIMKRSKINPDIVLLGIADFAQKQDSIHLDEVAVLDSLEYLQKQLTASSQENKRSIQIKDNVISKIKNEKYQFLAIGLLIGAFVVFIIFRKKR